MILIAKVQQTKWFLRPESLDDLRKLKEVATLKSYLSPSPRLVSDKAREMSLLLLPADRQNKEGGGSLALTPREWARPRLETASATAKVFREY